MYRPFVLRCRNRGAADIGVTGEGLAVDVMEARLILVVEILARVGDAGGSGKGDWARGVVECERCSSKSKSRGVIGLGIPGT